MRSIVLAALILAATAGPASAGGLSASGGDRYTQTTGLVAGRPAVIVSTLYLDDSDEGCEVVHALEATLTPPRGIAVDGPRTLQPRARGGARGHPMVNATWHVRAAKADIGWARVRWTATGADGRRCTGSQHLRIVASAAPPELSVVSAVRYRELIGVIVRGRLPGVTPRVGEAFDAFFTEQHVLGRGRHDQGDLLRPLERLQSVSTGGRFDSEGLDCMLLGAPATAASVPYRFAFTWNHAIGAASVSGSGSVPVVAAPRNETERACERQYRPVCSNQSPCEGGTAAVAWLRGL
jgi:hypothetical protein